MLSDEVACHVLRQFDHLRYVRQLTGWEFDGRPTPRSLPGCEILAYILANGSRVSRVLYILADDVDGIATMPAPDKFGGLPICPRSVACRELPTLYETALEAERAARAEHVRYWRELDAQQSAKPAPKPSFFARWIGGAK